MNRNQKMSKAHKRSTFYSFDMVVYQLDDMDTIAYSAKGRLCEALMLLPRDVVDFLADKCTFICQDPSSDFAEYFSFENMAFKKRTAEGESKTGFIPINPMLWNKKKIQIDFAIAHEVAHAYLGHKKATLEDTESAVGRAQEVAADDQAIKWLKQHYPEKELIKLTYIERGIIK